MPVVNNAECTDEENYIVSRAYGLVYSLSLPPLRKILESAPISAHSGCSFTVDKSRIYICPYRSDSVFLTVCQVSRIVLHELTHFVAKDSRNHDAAFEACYVRLERLMTSELTCPDPVAVRDFCKAGTQQ